MEAHTDNRRSEGDSEAQKKVAVASPHLEPALRIKQLLERSSKACARSVMLILTGSITWDYASPT